MLGGACQQDVAHIKLIPCLHCFMGKLSSCSVNIRAALSSRKKISSDAFILNPPPTVTRLANFD
jgi:hypothetical protein